MRGLLGRLSAGASPRGGGEGDLQAIVEHLRRLLNTRRGESVTAVDYGIEDLSDLIGSFPEATSLLQKSIRTTIERYEPRLSQLRVTAVPSPDPLKCLFVVSAQCKGSRTDDRRNVRFETCVNASGSVDVR